MTIKIMVGQLILFAGLKVVLVVFILCCHSTINYQKYRWADTLMTRS